MAKPPPPGVQNETENLFLTGGICAKIEKYMNLPFR
jgi:hypothetical protein